MAITVSGLSSGLDVNSIVSQLIAAESGPLANIATRKTAVQSKISAFGTLKSALSTFQTALANLSSPSKFNVQSTAISDSTVFSATANGKATSGDYSVTVTQLAQTQKLAMGGFANKTDTVGSGTLTITLGTYDSVGNSFTANADKTPVNIAIPAGSDSLEKVRDAINAADAGVTASIINDGSSNGNRLVITSKDSGTVNSIKIEVSDDDGNPLDDSGLSRLAYDPTATAGSGKNLTQMQAAKDALLTIDGIDIVKSSNTITDAVEGVTLKLLKESTGSPVNMNIATDSAAIEASVMAFVEAYNKLNTSIRTLTKYDETTKTGAILNGDATARTIATKIKSVITSTVSSGGAFNTLSQIGVGFKSDGTLSLDSTKLQANIASNFEDIAKLFATSATATDSQVSFVGNTSQTKAGTYAINVSQLGSDSTDTIGTINGVAGTGIGASLKGAVGDDSEGLLIKISGGATGDRGTITFSIGLAAQLNTLVSDFLNEEGILAAKTDGLNSSITRLNKEAEAQEARLDVIEKRYRAQFTALETLISSMNSTSAFLTQQLSQLSANSKS
ncbi:Flagellar hook-associated protein 2 [Methylophilaceae bacterium]|nr:Flagellar hook-associated protein 2 [Methylophilaceae bacterium]